MRVSDGCHRIESVVQKSIGVDESLFLFFAVDVNGPLSPLSGLDDLGQPRHPSRLSP
jgi:hypothetical protein